MIRRFHKDPGEGSEVAAETDASQSRQARSISSIEDSAGDLLSKAILGIMRSGYGELTMRQMAILLLTKDSGMNVKELARKMGITPSSVSRSASTLEGKKLIRRTRNGRSVIINATPKGEAVIGRSVMDVAKGHE